MSGKFHWKMFGAVIAALVQAGIGVESVGFDPPWPAQVMGRAARQP